MAKRFISANFKDGTRITRNTANDNLAFGWCTWTADGRVIVTGFCSASKTPPDVTRILKNYKGSTWELVRINIGE